MRPLVLAVLLLASALPLHAAQAPEPTQTAQTISRDAVPVPQPSEKALRYYRSGNVLWVVNTVWSLAALALLLWTGLSARLRDLARRMGRNWFFTVALYGVLFTLVTFVLDLPLAWYGGFVRQHAYGLSTQTAAKWWSDQLISLALGCVFLALTLWFPYLLLRKSPGAGGSTRGSRAYPSSRSCCSSRPSGSSRCSTISAP
jgi:STE24 endopeptidase